MKKVFLSMLFAVVFILSVHAADIPNYQDKYVNDFGKVLDASSVSMLRNLFYEIDQNTTAEVVFVSMESIGSDAMSDYATRLGQQWGVGKSDKDNGIVILYVKDVNKIWVSTGYGVEGILPDSKVGRLLDENYVPSRDAGNVQEGIVKFSTALSQVLYDNREEILSGQAAAKNNKYDFLITIIAWIMIYVIISSIINRIRGKKHGSGGFFFLPIFFPRGSGSGGGGFGGGGFGGGGFGGGGAGR